jgi:hypothetical protein
MQGGAVVPAMGGSGRGKRKYYRENEKAPLKEQGF